jgi:hypothetical protein
MATDDANKLWRTSTLGVELAAAIIGMTLGGYLIDAWLKTSPIGLFVGLALGFVGGGTNFIRRALAASRSESKAFSDAHPHGLPKPPRPRAEPGKTAESMFGRTVIEDDEEEDGDRDARSKY